MPRHSPGRSLPGAQQAAAPAAAPATAAPVAAAPVAAAPAAAAPATGLPSPPGLVFDTILVQPEGGIGLTVPRFRIPDGRSTRQAQVTWLPQRYLEMLLFYRTDGGSSGAVNKLLNKVGLGSTAIGTLTAVLRGYRPTTSS